MKGFSLTVRLVMAVVIMVAIAFILISITSGNLGSFSGDVSKQQKETGEASNQAAIDAYCTLYCQGKGQTYEGGGAKSGNTYDCDCQDG